MVALCWPRAVIIEKGSGPGLFPGIDICHAASSSFAEICFNIAKS